MTEEEVIKKFDEFTENYPKFETEIYEAILNFERVAFEAAENGKAVIEKSESRLSELGDLIKALIALAPMSEEIESRFMQALVSLQPRLETALKDLKRIAENPPTESLYPQFEEPLDEIPNEEEDVEVTRIVVEKWNVDSTQTPTEEVSQTSTEEATQTSTEEATQTPTEEVTQTPTEEATQTLTEEVTRTQAQEATQTSTEEVTQTQAADEQEATASAADAP